MKMKSKRLLVEGKDDYHTVVHICEKKNIPEVFDILPKEGITEVYPAFEGFLKESGIEVVGVLVDADTNLSARWQSLRNVLVRNKYPDIPENPDPAGTIIAPPDDERSLLPRVGIWLMPDNRQNGILEDFLKLLVSDNSKLYEHVQSSVATIPEPLFRDVDKPKALIHTWLAWQEEPGKPFGTAITANYLDTDSPHIEPFAAWLKNLFL